MKLIQKNIALMGALLLTACTMPTLTTKQCLSGNWQAIGYNDGVAGHYQTRINNHQQACAETGIIPNFQAWEQGRRQGLIHYCTEANARQRGQSGLGFNAVCPENQAERLQRIHASAYNHYERNQSIKRDERKLKTYRQELRRLRDGDMLHFETESEARDYMLRLQDEIRDLERNIEKNRRANRMN